MALVLVLIFTVLLYAMVSELVTTAQTARLTGENDVLLTRMRGHMEYVFKQVEETLLDDLAAAQAGEGDAGGMPGGLGDLGGGDAGAPGLPGGEEEEEPDPAAIADGSQDAWFEPTAHSDNDVSTYVWVEDENRKFNILTLVSPDEDFAQKSRERFVRLIDALRDGTDDDLARSQGETLADDVISWMEGRTRGETLPRPPLKSDDDERSNITLPLQLDEMLLLTGVDDDLFFDKVLDGRVILGLEAVLTVYTSLVFDPGDPDDLSRQQPDPAGEDPTGEATPPPGGEGEALGDGEPGQPQGLGIRININTASRPVLRSLFSPAEVADSVIEAILRYRNEPVEQDPYDLSSSAPEGYLGDIDLGEQEKRQMFTDLAMLEELPEFANLPDPQVKEDFLRLLTVNSDVFTIHLASLYRRNEETRTYVLQRARSVVVRLDEGEEGYLHPLVLHEERRGLRVMPSDFPDDDLLAQASLLTELDAFSQEERAWNPFYIDFYRPKDEREQLFNYRDRLR